MVPMNVPKKRVNVVEFLEICFGEKLCAENRSLFVNIDRLKCDELFNCMIEYINTHENYYIPKRQPAWSCPFVWHEIAQTADKIGGNAFNRQDSLGFSEKSNHLRDMLLLHHQVMITDQLDVIISALASGASTYDQKYQEYVDFLINNRILIDKGILVICSDRQAYEVAPVNRDPNKDVDADIGASVGAKLREQDPDLYVGDTIGRILSYMKLTDDLNAVEFFDNQHYLNIYIALHNYWQAKYKEPPVPVTFKSRFDLSAERLTDQDFVNIRLNDDVFEQWRIDLEEALQANTKEEFQDKMEEGIRKFEKKSMPIWKGVPKSLIFGTLSGILTGNPLVGAGIGTGFEVIDRIIQNKLTRSRTTAKNSLLRHYTALIRQ